MTRYHPARWIAHLAGVIFGAMALAVTAAAPSSGQPPGMADPDKTVLLAVRCTPNRVILRHAFVKNIRYVPRESKGNYRYSLASSDGAVLHAGSFSDPHEILIEDFSDPVRPRSEKGRREIAEIILKIPYYPDARHIQFQRQETSGAWVDLGTSRLVISE